MLQIKTTKLQELVSKAIKGVGNDKTRPITQLMAIKVVDSKITIVTTDFDNYLYVSEDIEGTDDFYAVFVADQFAKLIARTTSENVTLTIQDSGLEVKGNGTYIIPLSVDVSTGDVVEYPDPIANVEQADTNKIGELDVATIKTILGALKPALATTVAIPQYVNYYFGDLVMATDTYKVGCLNKKITSTPILVGPEILELLDVYSGNQAMSIYLVDNKLLFVGDNCTVYGYAREGIESYAVDRLLAYVEKEYPSKCVLPKQEVLQLIDRLSLFVSEFDEDIVNILFTEEGIQVSSQKSDSVELIPYVSNESFAESSGSVYLEMFRSQVKAQTGDTVELYFGDDTSLKLVDNANSVTSVVSLV